MASSSTSRLYSLDEVVVEMGEMSGSPDAGDEWSDDEFEGYIDDEQQGEDRQQSQSNGEESHFESGMEIGGECEVGDQNQIPVYSETAGCNHPCDNSTPLDFLEMLLTNDILDNIVEQTNLYASQYISSHNLPSRSRVHNWEPLTREELKKFIALIIIMGLVNMPTLEDHWKTTWPYSSMTFCKVK